MQAAIGGDKDFKATLEFSYQSLLEDIETMPVIDLLEQTFRNAEYKQKQGLVYIPKELAYQLLDTRNLRRQYNKHISKNKEFSILITNALSGMLPVVARELYPEAIIECVEYFPYYVEHLIRLGFTVTDINYDMEKINEMNKRFTQGVGNPPYSLAGNKTGKKGRAKNLYPIFYEKMNELCDNVSMIVPRTDRQHTAFNSYIREHTNKIIDIDDSAMGVNISTWCLINDNSNDNVDHIEWADLIELPEQKVKWAKGKINVTTEKDLLEDKPGSFTVFHKVNTKAGLIQSTTASIQHLKLFPSNGYAVIMPQQMQGKGWSITEIIKCNGKQAATNGVNIAFIDTLEEAEYLVEYMKSDNFIEQALAHCGGMNNMTLGAMQMIDMSNYAY
jgi:hypothetical protein